VGNWTPHVGTLWGRRSKEKTLENRASPREINDRTYRSLRRIGAEEGDFACECGGERCNERIELLPIQYAARDDGPLLAPGHEPIAPADS
jgi:hypothetical protein